MKGLIGYTGFVGSNILEQHTFDKLYRSTNIESMKGQSFDLLVCAGASAVKWIANSEPEADWKNLEVLMRALSETYAQRLVLISTIDVYNSPKGVNEETSIDASQSDAYGMHRFLLEEFVRDTFDNVHIVRLPGLFGRGLKKNFIYDLIHSNALEWTHQDSKFQMYDLSRLWLDIEIVLSRDLPLVNFATSPVTAKGIASQCFGIEFCNLPDKVPADYDVRTKFADEFGGSNDYFYSEDESYSLISKFLREEYSI